MYPHNSTFVSKLNIIIKKYQIEAMDLIIETCDEDKAVYEKQIDEIKSKLIENSLYTEQNVSSYMNKLYSKAEISLEKTFRDSDEKLKEIINSNNPKEYSVLETPPNNKSLNSSNNYNDSNDNRKSKKRKRSNNIQFTPSSILKSNNNSSVLNQSSNNNK
jgi:hypothetical protein